jgi:hypothetical protein
VRFTEFLRTAVLSFGAGASALALATLAGANAAADTELIALALGWWVLAAVIGLYLGRQDATSPGIARLLSGAKSLPSLPEPEPMKIVVGRLWMLIVFIVVCAGLSFVLPQVPAIATGYALIPALAWRKQEHAVSAIEERDGACFYVEKTSPFRPTQLVRTPSFRRLDHVRKPSHDHDLAHSNER